MFFFKLKGGQIIASNAPNNNVCNLVSVPKYTRELLPSEFERKNIISNDIKEIMNKIRKVKF